MEREGSLSTKAKAQQQEKDADTTNSMSSCITLLCRGTALLANTRGGCTTSIAMLFLLLASWLLVEHSERGNGAEPFVY